MSLLPSLLPCLPGLSLPFTLAGEWGEAGLGEDGSDYDHDIPVILCPKDQQLLKHITINCVAMKKNKEIMDFSLRDITLLQSRMNKVHMSLNIPLRRTFNRIGSVDSWSNKRPKLSRGV